MTRYWLFKSEPETFGIDDLCARGREPWDGVRNYQARNFLRDDVAVGDLVLFYHSNAQPPGIAGLARVVGAGRPDPTALDPDSKYHDPRASPENPRWYLVDVEYVETFPRFLPLAELKDDPALAGMRVTQRGQRLSIQPVEPAHFRRVLHLAEAQTKPSRR